MQNFINGSIMEENVCVIYVNITVHFFPFVGNILICEEHFL